MIVYNVTVKIESSVHEDWLKWMKEVHVPDVMKTGLFVDGCIRRILYQDEEEGISYSIQYRLESMEKLEEYQANHAKKLQADHTERYQGKYVAFRTLMEEVKSY